MDDWLAEIKRRDENYGPDPKGGWPKTHAQCSIDRSRLISELEQARERIAELEAQGLKLVLAEALVKDERDAALAEVEALKYDIARASVRNSDLLAEVEALRAEVARLKGEGR